MGELNEQQMIEVDQMVQQHPQVQEELEKLRLAINQYAKASDREPSREILNKVLAGSINSLPDIDTVSTEVQYRKPIWAMAATFSLLVSIGFNIYFVSELGEKRNQVEELTSQRNLLAGQVEKTTQQLEYAELRVAHFLNDDNVHVRMDGSELSPESFANVFWNKKSNAVFISVDNLPEPPHGHQYQLWAIKEGQAPIDAGIFDHNNLVQRLKIIQGEVLAFAVTLEKEGGTPNATVENTYVKGFLKKS